MFGKFCNVGSFSFFLFFFFLTCWVVFFFFFFFRKKKKFISLWGVSQSFVCVNSLSGVLILVFLFLPQNYEMWVYHEILVLFVSIVNMLPGFNYFPPSNTCLLNVVLDLLLQ
jgi:hypothetical protein